MWRPGIGSISIKTWKSKNKSKSQKFMRSWAKAIKCSSGPQLMMRRTWRRKRRRGQTGTR